MQDGNPANMGYSRSPQAQLKEPGQGYYQNKPSGYENTRPLNHAGHNMATVGDPYGSERSRQGQDSYRP